MSKEESNNLSCADDTKTALKVSNDNQIGPTVLILASQIPHGMDSKTQPKFLSWPTILHDGVKPNRKLNGAGQYKTSLTSMAITNIEEVVPRPRSNAGPKRELKFCNKEYEAGNLKVNKEL